MENLQKIYKLSKNMSLLYVEDDVDILNKTVQIFEDLFMYVQKAANGEEGILRYKKRKFDLIVTDLKMPKKDGISMIEEIKKINPNQHIIVTSAHDDTQRLLALLDLEVFSFISKPLSTEKLFKVIYREVKKIALEKIEDEEMNYQAKMAQMGEMIDAVAHQWKQPLTAISSMAQGVNYKYELTGEYDNEFVFDMNEKIVKQVNYLVTTIDTFRGFLRPASDFDEVRFDEIVSDISLLLGHTIRKYSLRFEITCGGDLRFVCYKNEFLHILINLINNTKDAYETLEGIDDRVIYLGAARYKDNFEIVVCDRAGGIEDGYLDKIFKPHFSTKQTTGGTGIGLYFSKKILEKIGGTIRATNQYEEGNRVGVCFYITLPDIQKGIV